MNAYRVWLLALVCVLFPVLADRLMAAPAAPPQMPVKEVTIFKDGHAFVLRQGLMPTDAAGNVALEDLPMPVLGTFWPFSSDSDAALASVVAGQEAATVPQDALTLIDLLRANVGARVHVTETTGPAYDASIVSFPAPTDPQSAASFTPSLIILHTENGDKALPLGQIKDVTFPSVYKTAWDEQEMRARMMLNLGWKDKRPRQTASVGMAYLQSGLRWQPSYKVTIDGAGNAHVQLEATLVNDMIDLQDVTADLVIGVPSFAAQDTLDPIAVQQTLAEVAARLPQNSYFNSGGFGSNAYMSQVASPAPQAPAGNASPPETSGAAKNEDLFVFTMKHVTLRKGQRLVMSIAEYALKYTDVYTLDLPFAPPPEVAQSLSASQQTELAHRLTLPKVMHIIRLRDTGLHPLTTAPALILRGDRLLAQGTMTYTTVGADCDLEVTQALDMKARKKDRETQRTPSAVTWNGDQYSRIDLTGSVSLTNDTERPAALEITREVLGIADSADNEGRIEMLNSFDDSDVAVGGFPDWWGWYSWPYWWGHFNGMGRITWKLTLPPQKSETLNYAWHYFWR